MIIIITSVSSLVNLVRTKHWSTCYTILKTVISATDDAWVGDLTEAQKTRRPTEAEASCLSAAFGNGWEHVFSELGIRKAKIEQVQLSKPHSVSVIVTDLLIHWRQSKGHTAQFIVLLQAMQQVKDRCTIDWDIVEKVVKGQWQMF